MINKTTHFFIVSLLIFLVSCSSIEKQTTEPAQKLVSPLVTSEDEKQQQSNRLKNQTDEKQAGIEQEIKEQESGTDKNKENKLVFNNLWDRIPHLYKIPADSYKNIPEQYKQRISIEKKWYLDHPKYLYRVSQRALPYLYLIVEQLEQRDLPGELALLPIVESAFRPHAYSRGRAAGLWQFIPGTGKYFGLKQNWWYDGRRDIYASTNAALDYLEKLNTKFDNNWLLSLASYNAGAGTIDKAIKRNQFLDKGNSFWELDLSNETQAYVPKLLALAEIIEELKTNQIKLLEIKNEPYLTLVDCENHIDLAVAAELAGISIEDLYKYNAGFNQWATDPDGPHHLLLPVSAVDTFDKNFSSIDKNDLIRWSQYKIKQGDSLSRIAKKHSVSVNALKKANQLNNSSIRAGKYLAIPIANKGSPYYNPQVNKKRDQIIAKINAKKRNVYRVKRGDSLWTISRKYQISYNTLAKANGISPLSTLSIGQKLIIWSAPNDKVSQSVKYLPKKSKINNKPSNRTANIIRYRVKKGDSLYTIAKRHRASVDQLLKWNAISKNKYLSLGQKLIIYTN